MENPRIGIIGGNGRMGALFATFFRERGLKVQISDLKTKLKNKEIAKTSNITIVSVPIDKTEKVIKEVLPHIPKNSAIMDFTSVKEMPVKAMLKGKCEVLGIHPMFGDSNPIPGQTVILCPTDKSKKWANWIEQFLKKHKVKIQKMSAQKHDKIMNIAQGLIHFADITFSEALRRTKMPTKELLKYASKASELKIQLAARLIEQDAGLYGNIQIENPNTLKTLKLYKKSVQDLMEIVKKKNLPAFKKYFQNSKNFFKSYTKEAYDDSSYLIDKLIEKERTFKPKLKIPKKSNIAVLGPKNTFTDLAAEKYIKSKAAKSPKYFAKDIEEVFELVESDKVKLGIIPIENKLNGTIRETLDNLFLRKVKINEEISIPINHAIIILPHATAKDIKIIISHSQALKQCKKFLKKNFPKAAQESMNSTALAIEKLVQTNDKSIAAIAPKIAATKQDLKILKSNIEDKKDNETTFIVIEKGAITHKTPTDEQKTCTKTSIAFHFDADSPGSLFTVFKDFADAKINTTKIESRPTQAKFGDYIFYLDFEGSLSTTKVQKTLQKVTKKVAKLKVLGSY